MLSVPVMYLEQCVHLFSHVLLFCSMTLKVSDGCWVTILEDFPSKHAITQSIKKVYGVICLVPREFGGGGRGGVNAICKQVNYNIKVIPKLNSGIYLHVQTFSKSHLVIYMLFHTNCIFSRPDTLHVRRILFITSINLVNTP